MQRYRQIEVILSVERPKVIIEVGTWNGERAIRMCQSSGCEKYIGFDLFEEASPRTDQEEFNVKPHFSMESVSGNLKRAGVNAVLVKGNTRNTLPEFLKEHGSGIADFAFIDGGHSVNTIRSDYEVIRHLVRKNGIIVFDDFYYGMDESFLDNYGANLIVENLNRKMILPLEDPVKGGGSVVLVALRND